MKTPAWAHSTNIYEVNLRQYTAAGTFNAFQNELPRLKEMGVETLWFMPITPIAQKNKKGSLGSYYACSDYISINPEFGTLNDFKELVATAHAKGFKVIIDWVANHTGWDHKWTITHPEYYKKNPVTRDFKIASGMDDIIELDFHNPYLVSAMIDAMQFWITECDIDGYRCDLASWVDIAFWQKARPEVDALKHLFWLGEFDELEHPEFGKIFDASYSWTWMHRTEQCYKQKLPVGSLEELLNNYTELGDDSMRTWFTSNHDENSWNGTEYEKYGDMAKALAVFSATWNGIPLIYSGQELPLIDKRLLFFDKDPIPWIGEYRLHEFYRTLLKLHSTHPALRGGDANALTYRLKTNNADVVAFLRKKEEFEVLVVLNLSAADDIIVELSEEKVTGIYKNLFFNSVADFTSERKLHMKSWQYFVFVKE